MSAGFIKRIVSKKCDDYEKSGVCTTAAAAEGILY